MSGGRPSASTSGTRSSPTGSSGWASCRACAYSEGWPGSAPTASPAGGRWTGCWCGPTGAGSPCPTGRSSTSCSVTHGRFTRAATLTYAVFDVGASVYWVLPTAPPWYAATQGEAGEEALPVRRMMVEYGEFFWGDGWGSLYSVFGGNPLAAMPSLHFATSLMAASLLAETGRGPGMFGYGYPGDARVRAGVPRRALPRRPARGSGVDDGRETDRSVRDGAAESCRGHRLAVGGDGTRGGLRGVRVRAAVRRADRGGREREATETSSEEAGISTPEPDEDPTAKARLGERLAPAEPEESRRGGGAGRPARRTRGRGRNAAGAAHPPPAARLRPVRGFDRRLPVFGAAEARGRQPRTSNGSRRATNGGWRSGSPSR